MSIDPRTHAVRADLADENLKDLVPADTFVTGTPMIVTDGCIMAHAEPDALSGCVTEFLRGEPVTVFEDANGWSWTQSEIDSYMGYVPSSALGPRRAEATDRVTALITHAYRQPELKTAPALVLPRGAFLNIPEDKSQNGFRKSASRLWVYGAHLSGVAETEPDWIAGAADYLGAPYLWGGRTAIGIDCSGLVQVAMQGAGIECPRDTDMQEIALGDAVEVAANREVGDLVFFSGHVGIMLDESQMLHANAYHMAVTIEPLADVVARVAIQQGIVASDAITSVRRVRIP